MKYVVILFDGMADYPDEHGRTPMQEARKPHTDALCAQAEAGLTFTVPAGFAPGSDVANLAVFGYDPRTCYTGRSPLEAVSLGLHLGKNAVTYRANLVTLSDEADYENKRMLDYSAGEIGTAESNELIAFLAQNLPLAEGLTLHAGISYRHCLLRESGRSGAILTPPHDISGKRIAGHLPRGAYDGELRTLQEVSFKLLENHPINRARVKGGKNPANSIWLWGEGTKPNLQNFSQKTGLKGAVVSAVDLIKGIGIAAGMDSINVPGATGTLTTNFDGKARAAVNSLKTHDYVYVHLEAPDECGHQGDRVGKTRAIERIDEKIVAPVLDALRACGEEFSVLIMPDHPTPTAIRTHTADPVPYLLYKSNAVQKGPTTFSEESAKSTGLITSEAWKLIEKMR